MRSIKIHILNYEESVLKVCILIPALNNGSGKVIVEKAS